MQFTIAIALLAPLAAALGARHQARDDHVGSVVTAQGEPVGYLNTDIDCTTFPSEAAMAGGEKVIFGGEIKCTFFTDDHCKDIIGNADGKVIIEDGYQPLDKPAKSAHCWRT